MGKHAWERIDEDAGLWTREYAFRPGSLARMMTARAKDGSLIAISPASGLDDADFDALRKDGGVSAIIAPNGFHHLGLASWSAAFPNARLFAPSAAIGRVKKQQPNLKNLEPLSAIAPLLGDGVKTQECPGISIGEAWLTSKSKDGPVWYVSDSCFSMPEEPSALIPRLLFRWTKSAPGFQINGLGLKMFTKDKPAYKRFFLERLAEEAPAAVVTAHGAIVREAGLRETMIRMVEDRLS